MWKFYVRSAYEQREESWKEEVLRKPRKPSSRLPVELQILMTEILEELHPRVYEQIWFRGIGYSELIGTLKKSFPTVYEEVLDYALQPRRHREPERDYYRY